MLSLFRFDDRWPLRYITELCPFAKNTSGSIFQLLFTIILHGHVTHGENCWGELQAAISRAVSSVDYRRSIFHHIHNQLYRRQVTLPIFATNDRMSNYFTVFVHPVKRTTLHAVLMRNGGDKCCAHSRIDNPVFHWPLYTEYCAAKR